MADILEHLSYALFGAIATLVVRELYAWKFPELERRRERLEMLLEKVYGPIRVVTWRMDLDEKRTHKYWITKDEYLEMRRIMYLFGFHILVTKKSYLRKTIESKTIESKQREVNIITDQEYYDLLNVVLKQIMDNENAMEFFRRDEKLQLAIETPKITQLIDQTEMIYQIITDQIQHFHNMRSGFKNNLNFIFFTWRKF